MGWFTERSCRRACDAPECTVRSASSFAKETRGDFTLDKAAEDQTGSISYVQLFLYSLDCCRHGVNERNFTLSEILQSIEIEGVFWRNQSFRSLTLCCQDTTQHFSRFITELKEKAVQIHHRDKEMYSRLDHEYRQYKQTAEETITVCFVVCSFRFLFVDVLSLSGIRLVCVFLTKYFCVVCLCSLWKQRAAS